MAAFVPLLILTSGWLYMRRADQPASPIMILDRGHMNNNDWRLYWFVPELDYLRPFTDPLYDLQVIGWWQDWLYFSGNTGWFEDTTGNQLRNVYRVRVGDHHPESVVGPVIKRGIAWLPDQNRLIYPAPMDANRTDLFNLNLADGRVTNMTTDLTAGMNVRRLPLDISLDSEWVLFFAADLPNASQYAARTDATALMSVGRKADSVEYSLVEINHALFQLGTNGDLTTLPASHVEVWLPDQNMLVSSADGTVIGSNLSDLHVRWEVKGNYLTASAAGIYIQRSDGSTVKMPLQGDSPEPIADDIAMLWGWTPDGAWLVYQDGNGDLSRIRPDTRESALIRPLNGGYLYNIGPSPDGAWWLFLESTATTTTLNRIRLNGKDEQQLLVLESRRPLPTTVFAGWTPPYEKKSQPFGLMIGGVIALVVMTLASRRR